MNTTVEQLLEGAHEYDLDFREWVVSPQLAQNVIASHRIQKPGLALTGFLHNVHPNRVQIFGETEMAYLDSLSPEAATAALQIFCDLDLSLIACTKGIDPPQNLQDICTAKDVALVGTSLPSSKAIEQISNLLADLTAEEDSRHGVMVDVFGVGVLISGESGVGKSETGLDLVLRGHRLVADDIVDLHQRPGGSLIATSPRLTRHHMEVRGLGIINVKELYGVSAVRERKRVEMLVELVHWDKVEKIDRLGISREEYVILQATLPLLRLPVTPGRDIAGIIEVAARDFLLRLEGVDSARRFQQRVEQEIRSSTLLHSERNDIE